MTKPGGVEIEGMANLRRTVKAAGGDLKDFTALNKRVATVVAYRGQSTAPVGPPERGHIARTVRASGNRTAAIIRAGNNTTFPYANPIHWGWFRRGIKPNPWLSRAAQETESTWRRVYMDGINTIVRSIRGK